MMHIDKAIKDKLHNYESDLSPHLWDSIANQLDDKSSRSLLWLWFVGILGLILGGWLVYKSFLTEESDQKTSPPLAHIVPSNEENIDIDKVKVTHTTSVTPNDSKTEVVINTSASTFPSNPQKSTLVAAHEVPNIETVDVKSRPANIIITKSYINSNGAVIKQSELSKDGDKIDEFEVSMKNGADNNAGALLRIIEPLEFLPLINGKLNEKKKEQLSSSL